ncbi:MAG TPA: M14 family zinc carboxypeptidase, partial [Armatimonadota bacterium]|nr:M14 family zinc carboxypeptidase [Armatimonadota bacterium]
MVTISTDFECGNGKNIEQVADGRFRMEVDACLQESYCVYWCFEVANEGPAREVTVELWEDQRFGGPTGFHVFFPSTVWIQPEGLDRYRPLHETAPEWHGDHIVIALNLPENGKLRCAMTYVAPCSFTSAGLRGFAEERPDRCELFSIGESVQGRDIVGLRAGTPGKPKVLCIAGQHPHEHAGVWAEQGIADFMSSMVPAAAALREHLDVWIIPNVNPDGNVLGRNAFTSEPHNMCRAFDDEPDADEPTHKESLLLWRWATEHMPALWVNFHCYTGWQGNSEYPYDGWYEVDDRSIYTDAKQRLVYDAICDTMRLMTDGPSTHEQACHHNHASLCHQLAKRHDIPHAFYE